jgi:DNA-binding MarR family transcriptional regulator
MTPGRLAAYTGFTTGGITRVIDHLESRGFVQRRIDKTDRRTITIEPLPSGKYTFGKQSVSFDPIIDALLERYDEKEFAVITDFLGYGAELFQEMSQRLNTKK